MNAIDIKAAFKDNEKAVSPVIGVILMVAITVILAAVIGAFVLQGNNLNAQAPQVSWDYGFDSSSDNVTITHEGGDDLEAQNVVFTGSALSSDLEANDPTEGFPDATVSAGDSATLSGSLVGTPSGKTVRLIWTSPEGGSSSTIGTYEIP